MLIFVTNDIRSKYALNIFFLTGWSAFPHTAFTLERTTSHHTPAAHHPGLLCWYLGPLWCWKAQELFAQGWALEVLGTSITSSLGSLLFHYKTRLHRYQGVSKVLPDKNKIACFKKGTCWLFRKRIKENHIENETDEFKDLRWEKSTLKEERGNDWCIYDFHTLSVDGCTF